MQNYNSNILEWFFLSLHRILIPSNPHSFEDQTSQMARWPARGSTKGGRSEVQMWPARAPFSSFWSQSAPSRRNYQHDFCGKTLRWAAAMKFFLRNWISLLQIPNQTSEN
ncbi:hypothetical protein JTE90_013849 [Oedothorax gibbosus]|uniref:Uncharacterized protein n=1 Tax=Oedothorax gibbosus TaxID=931172 RepID=A0AAV6ULC9_9ARAC|nr:hypothetical protein JTE90_013849 [Oedothorax gibbosus]